MKRRGPPLVSAAKRVRATNARRRLARRAIDIDETGRVTGLAPELQRASTERSELESASYQLAGIGDADTAARRNPIGIIPDRDDIERAARAIADLVLTPVDIVVDVIKGIESFPKFLLVGYVLVELTRREHRAQRRR